MRDDTFVRTMWMLSALFIVYGVGGTIILVYTSPSDQIVQRFLSSFGPVFAGVLGLASGYLLGRSTNGDGGDDAG